MNHLLLLFGKPRNETFIVRLGEHILEGVGSYDPDVTGELPLGWFGSEIKSDHFQTWRLVFRVLSAIKIIRKGSSGY